MKVEFNGDLDETQFGGILGKKMNVETVYKVSGAKGDASVTMTKSSKGIEVTVIDKNVTAIRDLFIDKKTGKLVMENQYLGLTKGTEKGTGIGTDFFSRQVEEAIKAGVSEIRAYCAGDGSSVARSTQEYSGYYVWARLGFQNTEPVPAWVDFKDIPFGLRKYASFGQDIGDPGPIMFDNISDLMSTKEGREFWREHGAGFEGVFSLKKGSRSRKILEAYRKAKAEKS